MNKMSYVDEITKTRPALKELLDINFKARQELEDYIEDQEHYISRVNGNLKTAKQDAFDDANKKYNSDKKKLIYILEKSLEDLGQFKDD